MATCLLIDMDKGTWPIHKQPYGARQQSREVLRERIDMQLEAGIIEPAQSEWISLIVQVLKKNGTFDFVWTTGASIATRPDTFLPLRMDDCLDR